MSVNEDLADAAIDYRLDLLRFEAGVVAQLTAALESALSDVTRDLRRADTELRAGRISEETRGLLNQRRVGLQDALAAVYLQSRDLLAQSLAATAQVGLYTAAEAWKASTAGAGPEWVRPPIGDVLAALESPVGSRGWPTRLALQLQQLTDGITPALAAAAARGASVERIARELSHVQGLAGASRSALVSLARTEIQRVAAVAAEVSYAANADVLDGVEYLATLDSRTCLVCAPTHGQTYRLNEERPAIPRHPRCRCFYAPVTKSWAALGLGPAQASLFDGKPSGGPTFEVWLERQPPATAEAILGSARAEAWREGVPLAAFSDGRTALSLADLQARYPDAF